MIFFRIFQHLLPRAKAWNITANKTLRSFFVGLSSIGDDVKEFSDRVWQDLFPTSTREISAWEQQFGLPLVELTDEERRDRLLAAWRALGGQSPRYIQDTLHAHGFIVYIHEWWQPDTTPQTGIRTCATARDPRLYIRSQSSLFRYIVECDEPGIECGEPIAQSGNSIEPQGFPLVNKISFTEPDFYGLAGKKYAEAGEITMDCGDFGEFIERSMDYTVPDDMDKWPYFLWFGGEVFGELADVPAARRNEFEALCFQLCPTQNWLGMLINYI